MTKIKSKHHDLLNYFLYDNKYLSEDYIKKSKEYLTKIGKQRGKLDNNPNRSNLFKTLLDKS